ncbi:hypothetical protein NP493_2660g00011 [Ridgeia piscesae]|uniref:Uncharacterized protein n=1 Tax=Ridgeia piscesae TaxID=27915 RepID=A0AAD9N1X5_RIDPI|nr:hypothetical protein NP493_2660g00011 [Ridgeia piscesae]
MKVIMITSTSTQKTNVLEYICFLSTRTHACSK